MLLLMKRCEVFLPFSSYCSLKFFDRTECSVIVNTLLKNPQNNTFNGTFQCHAKITAIYVVSVCGQTDVSLKYEFNDMLCPQYGYTRISTEKLKFMLHTTLYNFQDHFMTLLKQRVF